jgi:hypothetical protein
MPERSDMFTPHNWMYMRSKQVPAIKAVMTCNNNEKISYNMGASVCEAG